MASRQNLAHRKTGVPVALEVYAKPIDKILYFVRRGKPAKDGVLSSC